MPRLLAHRRRLVAAGLLAVAGALAPAAVGAVAGGGAGLDITLRPDGGPEIPVLVETANPGAVASPAGATAAVEAPLPGLDGSATVAVDLPDLEPRPTADPPACGALDQPETGVQGDVPLADQRSGRAREGYSCGLSLVGANTLGGRSGNANMAWSGDCAYVAGNGIAVVDVADPLHPVQVRTLHGPGSDATLETLHAVDAPDRSILVAGRYSLYYDVLGGGTGSVDVYDVADCRNPVRLSTIEFPLGVHNLTLSADGRRVWTTLPVQAADLTDPARPVYQGNLEDALRATGVFHLEYAHEVRPTPDGTRVYLGGQIVGEEELLVVDLNGWPNGQPTVVGSIAGPGHSIVPATVGGRAYLLHSDESIVGPLSNGCLPAAVTPAGGPAEPLLTDITDPSAPFDAGALRLEINQPEHCLDAIASGVDGSAHYQDVDDPDDTTFAMVSMWNSGLRIFDVRDPANPVEVAYFNPGLYDVGPASGAPGTGGLADFIGYANRGLDTAWAHVRYRADTGQIWLTTRAGGFWVLELQPQVRARLGLPAMAGAAPDGGPARPADGVAGPTPSASIGAADAVFYCTLGRATGLLGVLPAG